MQNLELIEEACYTLYNPKSPEDVKQAEVFLSKLFPVFGESNFLTISNASPTSANSPTRPSDAILNCKIIIESSSSSYAQMFAILQLKSLVNNNYSNLPSALIIELRILLLTILSQRNDLEYSVVSNLSQLFCLVTKLGWMDIEEFKLLLPDVNNFLKSTPEHMMIGLQILTLMISEMNLPKSNTANLSRHRKIAINFRDGYLLDIFQISLSFLKQLSLGELNVECILSIT